MTWLAIYFLHHSHRRLYKRKKQKTAPLSYHNLEAECKIYSSKLTLIKQSDFRQIHEFHIGKTVSKNKNRSDHDQPKSHE